MHVSLIRLYKHYELPSNTALQRSGWIGAILASRIGSTLDTLTTAVPAHPPAADAQVALALWPDHPYNQLLPPAPDFHGWELEFTERPLHAGLNPFLSVPEGCGLRPIDAAWFARCRYHDYYTAYFGSAERTLEQGFGFCLVREQELLSEAFAAAAALGMIEIGTITGEAYRGRGYQDAALDDASSWFLIGHDVGEAIAIALIHPFRARGGSGHAIPGTWFLSLIYVLADRWGTGIGGMMLDAVIDEANRRGCHQIYLWTHECQNERAHRLYRSRGFARTGRTICARSLSTLPVVPPARSSLPPDLVHCCVSVSQVRNRTRPAGEKVLG